MITVDGTLKLPSITENAALRALFKNGPGTLVLSDSHYSGYTAVYDGRLLLIKPSAPPGSVNAVPADLSVGDGIGGTGSDSVLLLGSDQIADSSRVLVRSSGLLDLNGFDET